MTNKQEAIKNYNKGRISRDDLVHLLAEDPTTDSKTLELLDDHTLIALSKALSEKNRLFFQNNWHKC